MNWLNIIKNLMKGGKQAKTGDDSGDMLTASCDFLGQTRNVKQLSSYGFYSHPVLGSNWLIYSSRANSDDLYGIGNDYKNRPKNLKEGEVVLQNLLTGAFIKLDAVSNIELFTDKDILATAENITATANATATINAADVIVNATDANINADNVTATATVKATVEAPQIDLNGAVKITGGLVVDGVIFGTHRHAPSLVPPSNP